MTAQQISDLFHASPFKPFQLFLADGRTVGVSSLDVLMLVDDGRSFTVFDATANEIEFFDLMMVVSFRIPESGGGEPANAPAPR